MNSFNNQYELFSEKDNRAYTLENAMLFRKGNSWFLADIHNIPLILRKR